MPIEAREGPIEALNVPIEAREVLIEDRVVPNEVQEVLIGARDVPIEKREVPDEALQVTVEVLHENDLRHLEEEHIQIQHKDLKIINKFGRSLGKNEVNFEMIWTIFQ